MTGHPPAELDDPHHRAEPEPAAAGWIEREDRHTRLDERRDANLGYKYVWLPIVILVGWLLLLRFG